MTNPAFLALLSDAIAKTIPAEPDQGTTEREAGVAMARTMLEAWQPADALEAGRMFEAFRGRGQPAPAPSPGHKWSHGGRAGTRQGRSATADCRYVRCVDAADAAGRPVRQNRARAGSADVAPA